METREEIPHVEKRTDKKGRKQPSRKPRINKPPEVAATIVPPGKPPAPIRRDWAADEVAKEIFDTFGADGAAAIVIELQKLLAHTGNGTDVQASADARRLKKEKLDEQAPAGDEAA